MATTAGRASAAELHEWLGLEGHEVFLAEDLRDGIAVGEEWQQRLHERLRWADAVVCVVTSAYLASRWCTAEAAISWSRGSRLLPLRAEPGWWTLAPIVPGVDPVAALVRELATAARGLDLGWTVADVRDQLDQDGLTGVVDELLLAAPRGSRRLLVVVDQFEELLTQAAPADRVRFAKLLQPALAGPLQLVAMLRSEFLDQLLLEDESAALPMRTYPLRPLGEKALRAVIERPARLVGIGVDDDLVDRLVEDTGSGEALPLLAFALAQLAEGVGRGGQLSRERYDQLGGVQGALTRQAEQAR